MRRLALILPLVFGFGQRPAPVASGDLNGDGRQEQVYLQQVRPYRPGNYDDGIMPQPKVSSLSFSDPRIVVHAMVSIPSPCSGMWTGTVRTTSWWRNSRITTYLRQGVLIAD